MCLNAQITLQYKPHKQATKLIVTILTDINACNNNISINNKRGGTDHILSGGMISTDFLLFTVFGFFSYFFLCFLFFLGTILLLFGFIYIFKCFGSRTTQDMTGSRIPPPFLVREFSVLTRLKSYSR